MRVALTYTAALLVTAGIPCGQSVTESKTIGGKTIAITYSSPKVNGRVGKLFGKDGRIAQDPTYPVWRAGANAATKFHTDADLDVGASLCQRATTHSMSTPPALPNGSSSLTSRRGSGA